MKAFLKIVFACIISSSLIFSSFYPVQAQVISRTTTLKNKTSISYLPLSPHTTLQLHTAGRSTGKNVLVKDYLASTRVVGDQTLSYYPYGQTKLITNNSQLTTDKLYTNHRKIPNISTYHAGARFYSPSLGLFIQPDPVQGVNRYAYAADNPIMFNDPSGNSIHPRGGLWQPPCEDGGTSAGSSANQGSATQKPAYIDLIPHMLPKVQPRFVEGIYQMPPDGGIPDSIYYPIMAGAALSISAITIAVVLPEIATACVINPLGCTATAGFMGEVLMGDALPPGTSLTPQIPGPGIVGAFWADTRGSILPDIDDFKVPPAVRDAFRGAFKDRPRPRVVIDRNLPHPIVIESSAHKNLRVQNLKGSSDEQVIETLHRMAHDPFQGLESKPVQGVRGVRRTKINSGDRIVWEYKDLPVEGGGEVQGINILFIGPHQDAQKYIDSLK